ncbi:MAG: S8 family serine peptidase, partial [Planctomycetota bacterium]
MQRGALRRSLGALRDRHGQLAGGLRRQLRRDPDGVHRPGCPRRGHRRGAHDHGASCSGIIFGDGTGNPMGRGLLPMGEGIIADANTFDFDGPPRYTHTGELVEDPYFAVFQSSSVGSPQTTQYTTVSADTDAMLFDFDILHCQSQSNTGNQNSRPQAWAKNIVSVGGIRHHNTPETSDDCWNCGETAASIGPAEDGRIKPDLSNYYDNIFTVTAPGASAYTTDFGGTSGATPITCGHFGIFFQMWSEGLFNNPVDPEGTVFENRPHMTTAKAMMVNTARQYVFSGTSHDLTRTHQGWGFADVANLFNRRNEMLIVDETDLLTPLEVVAYNVEVTGGTPEARFTLVYADPPGTPGTTRHRINDLTLRVTSPGGTVYYGNNGLLAGNWSTAGGAPNVVDTVENVFVENPPVGTWTVEVEASEINQDGHVETGTLDADFALVVSGINAVELPLLILLPDGTPDLVPPNTPTDIAVTILDGGETAIPATATLHYRFDAGSFATTPMSHLGGVDYLATLPGAPCNTPPQFYFSVEGDGGSMVTNPADAPAGFYETEV